MHQPWVTMRAGVACGRTTGHPITLLYDNVLATPSARLPHAALLRRFRRLRPAAACRRAGRSRRLDCRALAGEFVSAAGFAAKSGELMLRPGAGGLALALPAGSVWRLVESPPGTEAAAREAAEAEDLLGRLPLWPGYAALAGQPGDGPRQRRRQAAGGHGRRGVVLAAFCIRGAMLGPSRSLCVERFAASWTPRRRRGDRAACGLPGGRGPVRHACTWMRPLIRISHEP
jgi:hypothetical protein